MKSDDYLKRFMWANLLAIISALPLIIIPVFNKSCRVAFMPVYLIFFYYYYVLRFKR